QPGPIQSLIDFADRVGLRQPVFALLSGIVSANLVAVVILAWNSRRSVGNRLFWYASLALMLFILEQAAVGVDVPFYDRYVLQVMPFMGIIAFGLLPDLSRSRIAVLLVSWVGGQFILWRLMLNG